MTPLQQAQKEWEESTTASPKEHYIGKKPYTHDFRKYGLSIAWLKWDGEYIEITKIESLSPRGGASTRLLAHLKQLADKYHIRIFGNAVVYHPDPPAPNGKLLTQQELEEWYRQQGFLLRKIVNTGITAIWYPDFPPD